MRLQDRLLSMARRQSKGEVDSFSPGGLGDPHITGPGHPHGVSYVASVAETPAFPYWPLSILGNRKVPWACHQTWTRCPES